MMNDNTEIRLLSESLVDELVGSVGLPKTRFTHWLFWHMFRRVTDRFSRIGAPFDRLVGKQGLPAASDWCLTHFCTNIQSRGNEHIPAQGPLLVAANHPGAYDALVFFSQLKREDILWISTEIPFLRLLPNTRGHILFTSRTDAQNRMLVMRQAVQHLRSGGTLVYFAAGHRDPDPAVFPGASTSIDNWLDVFDSFTKYVPGLQILPAIASGMVSDKWARHFLVKLRRKQIDRHRLAEFGQVISQLLRPGKFFLSPTVSFGKALLAEELKMTSPDGRVRSALMPEARELLRQHMMEFNRQYS